MKTVTDFIFLCSKITADSDCSCEKKKKRRFLLERKAMKKLGSILKSRDITLPAKICTIKAMILREVVTGCQSWTINKAEHRRTDAFNCGAREDS